MLSALVSTLYFGIMTSSYILFIGAVLIASCCQILLKKSADKHYTKKLQEYLNPLVIVAYSFLFLSSFLTILAYKNIPLKEGPIIQSMGYIIVLILSAVFLKEKITKNKLIGTFVILLGILIFTL